MRIAAPLAPLFVYSRVPCVKKFEYHVVLARDAAFAAAVMVRPAPGDEEVPPAGIEPAHAV
jgi:hypothetical protein